ncbi:MAG TPA: permease-like cell division protein FtsX [Actinomycetota bacterium]|jgi:cell division transport system permease protein|nr:permease-like cell division protein FtsX [Actinomycetota bacterium]
MALRVNYFVDETVSNLRRNVLLTLAAVSTVSISLLLLGVVMVGGEVLTKMVSSWEGKVELNVFLRDEATPEEIAAIKTQTSGMPEVDEVFFESKEQAFEEYKRMFKDSPAITENVDPNALPASYRIKLKDPNSAEAVASRLQGQPGVDEVQFGGEAMKRLLKFTGVVRTILVIAIVLTLGAAILLIANTIRLGIYARRKEIGIMKLVGATNWFIRVPFIFEGTVQAALGALVASALIYAGKVFGLDRMQDAILFLPLTVGSGSIIRMFFTLLLIGIVIGVFGSTLALRRFLEV